MTESKRGEFVMKGSTPELINTYWCRACKEAQIEHEVVEIPGPTTDRSSCWGSGLPTTMRQCSACKSEDGPWVDAKLVGGGY